MESIAAYTSQLRALLNKAMDMEAELEHVVQAIDFAPEDWQYMYENHRPLAGQLARLVDKYGSE